MTVKQEFEAYAAAVYAGELEKTDPATIDQRRQLQEAFFAGCLVAHTNGDNLIPELTAYSRALIARNGAAN